MSRKKPKDENFSRLAMESSGYKLISSLITKFGGLIFTIILARLLLPELFGAYQLAYSIVLIAIAFSTLGTSSTLIRYVSEALGKNNKKKARSYFRYILKIRLTLTLIAILIIIAISRFLAINIYDMPIIYLPLLFSTFYILFVSLQRILLDIFSAVKDWSKFPVINLFKQFFRVTLSALAIYLLFVILELPSGQVLAGIFLALSLAYLLIVLIIFLFLGKNRDLIFGKVQKINKSKILRYTGYVGLAALTINIFGSIDTLMLGLFVDSSFIGYYRAALTLVTSTVALFTFTDILLPMFTQSNKKRQKRGMDKAYRYMFILSIPATFGIIIIARYFIYAIYGSEYLTATIPLYALSLYILINPFIKIHSKLFSANEKPKLLSKAIAMSLVVNIVLNYLLISYLLNFGPEWAIFGAGLATVLSRYFYLNYLSIKSKKLFKIKPDRKQLIKPLISSLIMSLAIILFINFVDMNIIWGLLTVFIGAVIYFTTLYLIKGLTNEDIDLVKGSLRDMKNKFKRK